MYVKLKEMQMRKFCWE